MTTTKSSLVSKASPLTTALKPYPPDSTWLDYGCGDAAIALQAVKKDNSHLNCEGVTYPVQRDNLPELTGVEVHREDGDTFLAHQANRYDLITAVQSIRYSPDQWSTIKKAYRALKPGGVLLVDMVPNASMPLVGKDGRLVDPKLLEKELLKRGYQVEITVHGNRFDPPYSYYTFSIQKSAELPVLKLPIKLVTIPALQLDPMDRFATEFEMLGSQLPNIQYVYQLELPTD